MSKAFHYTVASEEANAVEVSVNSKGNVTFTVKAYATTLDQAKKNAVKKFRELQEEFKQETPEKAQG